MKKIKTILLISLICISYFSIAGGGKSKKERDSSENTEVAFKIKNLMLSEDYNSEKLEGTFVVFYAINGDHKINIIEIKGENEELKKDIFNHLQGKKLTSASPSNRTIKLCFNSH